MRRFPLSRERRPWKLTTVVTAVLLTGTLQAGCTVALLNASAAGDVDKARRLMSSGHGADERFPLVGTSPLMLAAGHGHADMLSVLIEAGADVNAADFTGWTALHAAAFQGNRQNILLLLEHGAIPSESHWYLQSPAEIAETLDHHELIPLLRRKENQPEPVIPSPQRDHPSDKVDVDEHRGWATPEGME